MHIQIEQLPAYESISQSDIASAAAALSAAKAAHSQAQKDVVAATQELPQSEWKDAEISAEARAQNKPEPKTRSHTVAAEKRIADLQHEEKVSQRVAESRESDLRSALDEHGEAWATTLASTVAKLDSTWASEVNKLIALHAERLSAVRVLRGVLGSDHPGVAAIPLGVRVLEDIDVAPGAPGFPANTVAKVAAEHVLSELLTLGAPPEAEKEKEPARALRIPSATEDMAGFKREAAERTEAQVRRHQVEQMGSPS